MSKHLAVTSSDGLPGYYSAQSSALEHDEARPGVFPGDRARRLIAHHVPKHSIPACIDGDLCTLQLPDPRPSTEFDVNLKSLSEAHFQAFQAPKASNTHEYYGWTIEAATKEVIILLKVFPYVKNDSVLLSMCAWFHLFCFFDDETEKMPPQDARRAMEHCIRILETTFRTRSTSRCLSTLINPLHRANVNYNLWKSSCLQSGGKIAYATYLFCQHAQRLLGPEAFKKVAAKINTVFKVYYCEVQWRQNIDNLSVQQYLESRSATIGLSPFWEILRNDCLSQEQIKSAGMILFKLESLVAAVVGLQNDLVGLAKDLSNGDRMNYILIVVDRESLSMEQALLAAVELHNWTVRWAMEESRRLERTTPDGWEGNAGLETYVECLLGFMSTHFKWASGTGRYQLV